MQSPPNGAVSDRRAEPDREAARLLQELRTMAVEGAVLARDYDVSALVNTLAAIATLAEAALQALERGSELPAETGIPGDAPPAYLSRALEAEADRLTPDRHAGSGAERGMPSEHQIEEAGELPVAPASPASSESAPATRAGRWRVRPGWTPLRPPRR